MRIYQRIIHTLNSSAFVRRTLTNFSIGLAGSVVLLLIGLGRTALMTKSLDLTDYGRVLVVLNFFNILNTFLSVRINDVLYRFLPKFSEEKDTSSTRDLLLLSLAISTILGLTIALGVFLLAPWIAQTFYQDHIYIPLFQVYAIAAFFTAFDGFSTAILRLEDRFLQIVVPQIVGAGSSLVLLFVYLYRDPSYSLEFIVGILGIGIIFTTVPTLVISLHLMWQELTAKTDTKMFFSLVRHRHALLSVLFQTNLAGYLKLTADTGGMFLLGILAGPSQVALYGIAQQLVRVFRIVQNNIQTAITPEIVSLWAQNKHRQLYLLIQRYTRISLVVGSIIVLLAVFLVRPVILVFATPEYLGAVPIFYVFLVTIYLTFVSLVYYPLALSMDELKRRNTVVATGFLFLGVAIVTGLTALSLAFVQLAITVAVRLFNDLPLFKKLQTFSNGIDLSKQQVSR